jgi:hypothetical protein
MLNLKKKCCHVQVLCEKKTQVTEIEVCEMGKENWNPITSYDVRRDVWLRIHSPSFLRQIPEQNKKLSN